MTVLPPGSLSSPDHIIGRNPELWTAAQALEASFLSTMLQSAGFGEAREAFGGGPGEAQFASMLASEQARKMTEAGGVGLAESIYDSLVRNASNR